MILHNGSPTLHDQLCEDHISGHLIGSVLVASRSLFMTEARVFRVGSVRQTDRWLLYKWMSSETFKTSYLNTTATEHWPIDPFTAPSSDHSNRTQPQHSHHNNHSLPLPFPIIKQIRNPYPINPLHHSGVEQQSPDKGRVCDTKIVTEIFQMSLKSFQWTHLGH